MWAIPCSISGLEPIVFNSLRSKIFFHGKGIKVFHKFWVIFGLEKSWKKNQKGHRIHLNFLWKKCWPKFYRQCIYYWAKYSLDQYSNNVRQHRRGDIKCTSACSKIYKCPYSSLTIAFHLCWPHCDFGHYKAWNFTFSVTAMLKSVPEPNGSVNPGLSRNLK